jgi:hypothetical protein
MEIQNGLVPRWMADLSSFGEGGMGEVWKARDIRGLAVDAK